MIRLIVLLSLISIVFAQTPIAPFRWAILSSANFNSRDIYFKQVQNALVVGAYFASYQRQNNGQGTYTGDGVQAIVYQYGNVGPTAAIAYYQNAATITNTSNGYDTDVSGSGAFLGNRHHLIYEWNPTTKTVVNTVLLGSLNYVISNSSYSKTLSYISLLGTGSNLRVEYTYIAASDLSNITVDNIDAGTVLAPKALEQIVGIDTTNYVYASPSNFLVHTSYVVTGQYQVQANVTPVIQGQPKANFVVSGSGSTAISYKSNGKCVAGTGSNAQVVSVNVTITGQTDFTVINGANDIVKQVQAKYGGSATIVRVDVAFNNLPGYQGIIKYDPTSISGSIPDCVGITPSGSLSLTFSFALLAILLLVFLF
jgi:hypothetical protein